MTANVQSLFPSNARDQLPYPNTPWYLSPDVFSRVQQTASTSQSSVIASKRVELLPTDPEAKFVASYFLKSAPGNLGIKKIWVIHNPEQTKGFEAAVKKIDAESQKSAFQPQWRKDGQVAQREAVIRRWEAMTGLFPGICVMGEKRGDPIKKGVKIIPLWHGSSEAVCKAVAETGLTFFGKHSFFSNAANKGGAKSTDAGYYGSGIYLTNSAKYANTYASGHLLMAWVVAREPYPVVNAVPHSDKGKDMKILMTGRGAYQNYNAHFIPVASPQHFPCAPGQQPDWDELVVFQSSQTLPRFWIELGSLPSLFSLPAPNPAPAQPAVPGVPVAGLPRFPGVEVTHLYPDGKPRGVKVSNKAWNHGGLKAVLAAVPGLEAIDLSNTKVSVDELPHLVKINTLKSVSLRSCRSVNTPWYDLLSSHPFANLTRTMPQLHSLDARGSNLPYDKIDFLAKRPEIFSDVRVTRVENNAVTAVAMRVFSGGYYEYVDRIRLAHPDVTELDLRAVAPCIDASLLSRFSKLTTLTISGGIEESSAKSSYRYSLTLHDLDKVGSLSAITVYVGEVARMNLPQNVNRVVLVGGCDADVRLYQKSCPHAQVSVRDASTWRAVQYAVMSPIETLRRFFGE